MPDTFDRLKAALAASVQKGIAAGGRHRLTVQRRHRTLESVHTPLAPSGARREAVPLGPASAFSDASV